jgi:hypothetical protein
MTLQLDNPSFSYTALVAGEIRLLEPTDRADGLKWTLRTTHLDDELKYDALSYVWGPQTGTFPIVCNGQTLHVHHNLYTALPYLARRYMKGRSRPIWIDAICINQKDEEEKFVQIGMMNKVYQSAEMVWVWLGIAEKQNRMAEAITLLPNIVQAGKQVEEHFTSPRTIEEKERDLANGMKPYFRLNLLDDSHGLNKLDADLWSAIFHLLSNPWY